MAGAHHDDNEEKPLDPAVERVRRKLLRFVVINLGLLFAAVMIVVAAIVYRSVISGTPPVATAPSLGVPSDEVIEGDIAIPAGSRVISHAQAGDRVSLDIELPDGERRIVIYDLGQRRVIARLRVRPE